MRSLILLTAAMAFFGCNSASQEKTAQSGLEKVWETDSTMTTAESVLYDAAGNRLFVSNINGDPTGKDGNGFISVLHTDGTVKQLKWSSGLNAPKGMAVMSGKLYVSDIDELVEIDLASGKITARHPVADAVFLNDVATDGRKVLVSDSQTGNIHVLANGKMSLFASGQKGINGLEFDKNGTLYSLDERGLLKHSSDGKKQEIINDKVTGGDGLLILDGDTFIASRWQGEIYRIIRGKEELLLDTRNEKSNTADIGFIPEQNLVLVPTFFKNKVVAYKLTPKGSAGQSGNPE